MDELLAKIRVSKSCDMAKAFLFEYETPRLVRMRSHKIGVTFRVAQLLILAYLVGYVFLYTKSYQIFDSPESSVVTKVKGMLQRDLSNNQTEWWDSNDFVVPAQETDAFFISTNLIWTENQLQGTCPEDKNVGVKGIHCKNNSECQEGTPSPYGNGIKTGKCVELTGTCENHSWCPTEADIAPAKPVLHGYDSVTVLVKNHVFFRKFGIKRRNILARFSEDYLQTCRFHRTDDPLCPVFSLRYMVTNAGESLDEMAVKGGVIGFNIDWDCNLDLDLEDCLPAYSFKRLDNVEDIVAKGWNFRHAYYHYDRDGISRRDLIKYWGIRFVYHVGGRAGRFYPIYFILHIGSSIGLFGVASMICEFLISCGYKSDLLTDSKSVKLEDLKAGRCASLLTGESSSHESPYGNNAYPGQKNAKQLSRQYNQNGRSVGRPTRVSGVMPVVNYRVSQGIHQ